MSSRHSMALPARREAAFSTVPVRQKAGAVVLLRPSRYRRWGKRMLDLGEFLLSVAPGITGSWQVSGRSAIAYPMRAELDVEYIEMMSLARDLRLLVRTLGALREMKGV